MRLKAFTLIEVLVTMIILSIIFTAVVLISFQLYKSLPPTHLLLKRNKLEWILDSLIDLHMESQMVIPYAGGNLVYIPEKVDWSENVLIIRGDYVDTLGNEIHIKDVLINEREAN